MGKLRWLIVLLAIVGALPTAAQSEDTPSVLDIAYDDVVQETITSGAFWDWWTLEASAGDQIVVDMGAMDGLEPLLGILNAGGDLVIQSEPGAANNAISLEYTAPADGQYTLVATRAGNADGTSAGSYALRVRLANPTETLTNPLQDVTFRCEDYEATTAATLRMNEDPAAGLTYRITVYGLDGFQPVIRVRFQTKDQDKPFELCNTDARLTENDTFTFPGEAEHTITADTLDTVSQLLLTGADGMGIVTVTIASREGAPGRYLAVLDGFSIEPQADEDLIEVRIGPLAAKNTHLTVYMMAAQNSRLDPFLTSTDTGQSCDDAGRGDCSDVPALTDTRIVLHEGSGTTLRGDRSDAGLILTPGTPDTIGLVLSSRSGDTHGGYALLLRGTLPPRTP
jgi:hypothetical protein